jgi:hypothetical protein
MHMLACMRRQDLLAGHRQRVRLLFATAHAWALRLSLMVVNACRQDLSARHRQRLLPHHLPPSLFALSACAESALLTPAGKIYPLDTYSGFRRIGFNIPLSMFAVLVIHGTFSYPSQDSWLPDPFLSVKTANIHRCKHGSDSESYDSEGRFVPVRSWPHCCCWGSLHWLHCVHLCCDPAPPSPGSQCRSQSVQGCCRSGRMSISRAAGIDDHIE